MIIVYFHFSTRAKWPITAWYATSMYNNKLIVEDTRFYLPFYIWMSENQKKKKVAKSCTHVLNCVSIDPAFNISISFSFSFLFLLETPINTKNTLAYWTIDAFNKHNLLTYWGFLFIFSTKFWTILLKSEKHILLIMVSIKISHEFFTINWPFTSKQSQLDSLVGLFCFLFSSLVYQRG